MNQRELFEYLMRNDIKFRKRVVSKASSFGMALFAAAKTCADTKSPEATHETLSPTQAKNLRGKDAGLTPKEYEVRKAMHEHKDLDEVSRSVNTNTPTLMCHIRHIFNKTGEDLMLLVGKKLRNNNSKDVHQVILDTLTEKPELELQSAEESESTQYV